MPTTKPTQAGQRRPIRRRPAPASRRPRRRPAGPPARPPPARQGQVSRTPFAPFVPFVVTIRLPRPRRPPSSRQSSPGPPSPPLSGDQAQPRSCNRGAALHGRPHPRQRRVRATPRGRPPRWRQPFCLPRALGQAARPPPARTGRASRPPLARFVRFVVTSLLPRPRRPPCSRQSSPAPPSPRPPAPPRRWSPAPPARGGPFPAPLARWERGRG